MQIKVAHGAAIETFLHCLLLSRAHNLGPAGYEVVGVSWPGPSVCRRKCELGIPAHAPEVGIAGRQAARHKSFLNVLAAAQIMSQRAPAARFANGCFTGEARGRGRGEPGRRRVTEHSRGQVVLSKVEAEHARLPGRKRLAWGRWRPAG
jgi:hypothetical protein